MRIANKVETGSDRDWFDYLIGAAQILTAGVALYGVPLLLRQVKSAAAVQRDQRDALNAQLQALEAQRDSVALQRREQRSQRTRGFQEYCSSRDFLKIASLALSFLSTERGDGWAADCVSKIESWETRTHAEEQRLLRTPREEDAPKPRVNDVSHLLAFFEDFGTAYNHDELDKDVVIDSFAVIPLQFFMVSWWFICWRRNGAPFSDDAVSAQFEKLVRDIRQRNRSVGDRYLDDLRGGVLCLPQPSRKAAAERWEESRALSTLLTAHRDRITALADAAPEPSARAPGEWRVILVPDTVDVDEQQQQLYERVSDVEAALTALDYATVESALV